MPEGTQRSDDPPLVGLPHFGMAPLFLLLGLYVQRHVLLEGEGKVQRGDTR